MASITTPSSISEFAKAIDPAVRKYYVDAFKQLDSTLDKVMRIEDQIDYNQQDFAMTGIGQFRPVGEGEMYTEDTPIQMYGTTYTPEKWGTVITITDEFRRYDKSNITKAQNISSLEGKAGVRTAETLASNVWNRATNVSYTSYGDALPLASTLHLRADGGTVQSNASATSLTFTEANLETGILAFRQQLDDRGQAIDVYPDRLMIPMALLKKALITTQSPLRNGTTDNDLNVNSMSEYKGGRLDILEWQYISAYLGGSDTRWFLVSTDALMGHKVKWLWGIKPQNGLENAILGDMNDTIKYKARFENSLGWSDWRGVWVSNGTGVAYSG